MQLPQSASQPLDDDANHATALASAPAPTQDPTLAPDDEQIFERDRFTGRTMEPWAHDGATTAPEDFEPRSALGEYGDYSGEV